MAPPPNRKLQNLRERVKRAPENFAARFALGEYLFQVRKYAECIPELQKARQGPAFRNRAMKLLKEVLNLNDGNFPL
ncbi:MAG: hypothetical protein ABIP97_09205 [Chthoniobacterales bacterium]